jgi:hypothetical protein
VPHWRGQHWRGGAVVTQAVCGLGGVSKSKLALQNVHAHGADHRLMWWIAAADAEGSGGETDRAGVAGGVAAIVN